MRLAMATDPVLALVVFVNRMQYGVGTESHFPPGEFCGMAGIEKELKGFGRSSGDVKGTLGNLRALVISS